MLQILMVAAGCQLREVHHDKPLISQSRSGQSHRLIVEVQTPPEMKGGRWRCVVSLQWEVKELRCYQQYENLFLYFRDTLVPTGWEAGTKRMIDARLLPIRNGSGNQAGNVAGRFDYAAWCARRHIYARAFISAGEGALISSPAHFDLRRKLAAMQEMLRQVCRHYLPSRAEGGLLEALLIGYTRDLDPDVMRDYSDAGVVHIIAISGLHLALIGELMQALLLFAGNGRIIRMIRLCLLLAVVWGYSLLTGASPSVLRSAVMFSFVVLARHYALEAPVYNALAGSAFLLLCVDPYRLWDTGFQLSYAAVLSLVLFTTPVRRWISPRNKLLIRLWQATSVSLAAQILTTPVSIWYFHRFPFYFLLTNLVAVPLSSAILLGGIGLIAFSGLPFVADPLARFLNGALRLMNGFVRYSNRLPGSAVTGIPIQFFQVILCYSVLYCGLRFAEKGEKIWLFAFLLQICAFLVDGLNNGLP